MRRIDHPIRSRRHDARLSTNTAEQSSLRLEGPVHPAFLLYRSIFRTPAELPGDAVQMRQTAHSAVCIDRHFAVQPITTEVKQPPATLKYPGLHRQIHLARPVLR